MAGVSLRLGTRRVVVVLRYPCVGVQFIFKITKSGDSLNLRQRKVGGMLAAFQIDRSGETYDSTPRDGYDASKTLHLLTAGPVRLMNSGLLI